MKQIVQNVGTGQLDLVEVPDPLAQPGCVLIANERSILSPGTERSAIELARKSLLGKARARPDHVRRVLQKVRQEGLLPTWRQVKQRLSEPMAMGYASAGVVLACGEGVQSFRPGDRVASNGAHAEIVCVPEHLCARVPDGVSFDHAAFTVLGAIALHGVRLAHLQVAETAFVVGLGLVGQLAVGILSAMGCRVLATDPDAGRCDLARRMGAFQARPGMTSADVEAGTRGMGADATLVAAATDSREPIDLAVDATRRRGRVVLLGVAGLEFDRRPMYFKEVEFVVSCSYGPGRYDPAYEERGQDYPAAYVRWTEQRNLQAVLDLMGDGKLDVEPLVTHRFPLERAAEAYDLIEKGTEPFVGVLLQHSQPSTSARELRLRSPRPVDHIGVGCLGAGSYARSTLLPLLAKSPGVRLVHLCSAGGLSAADTGRKLGFEKATADEDLVLEDDAVDAVFILTRHDQHARQIVRALRAGKHVFVEKPLALTLDEIDEVRDALEAAPDRVLMVGFNRRFAPLSSRVMQFFEDLEAPRTVAIRFNAGAIPEDHWTQDDAVGGGRIVGEACHAIDLATYLCGALPVEVHAAGIGGGSAPKISDDQCFITMRHANGSVSSVAYLAGGDSAFPKERVEAFCGGRVAVIENWHGLELVSGGRSRRTHSKTDKGHAACIAEFIRSIRQGGDAAMSWAEMSAVSAASILAVRSLAEGAVIGIGSR